MVDDSSNFPAQRRNLIIMSLAIILFIHAGGKITDQFHIGFVPLELHNPAFVLHFAVGVFIYFCYRFWVYGGKLAYKEMKLLNHRMIKGAYPDYWRVLLSNDARKQLSAEGSDAVAVRNIGLEDFSIVNNDKAPALDYEVTYNNGESHNIDKAMLRYRFSNHPLVFFHSFWWALKDDPTISEYLVPYVIAIYALFLMIEPYLIKVLYLLHILPLSTIG